LGKQGDSVYLLCNYKIFPYIFPLADKFTKQPMVNDNSDLTENVFKMNGITHGD